jgi:hypothetical protein
MTQHGMSGRSAERKPSPLFELACALVRFDHVASLHRKRELQRHVNGCKTLRSRLRC